MTAATSAAEERAARRSGRSSPPSDCEPSSTPTNSPSSETTKIAELVETVDRLHATLATMSEALETVHSVNRTVKAQGEQLEGLSRAVENLSTASKPRQPAGPDTPAKTGTGTSASATEAHAVIAELRAVEARTQAALKLSHLMRAAATAAPFAAALAMVLVFLVPLSEIAGVGPVARWVWASFAATDSTGTRLLIIVTMAAATVAVLWVVYRLGLALTRRYHALIEEGR